MRRSRVLLYSSVIAVTASGIYGAAFIPGDLVVYRVGDNTAALSNSAAPVFLDEYNPATHALVQSIPLTTVDGQDGNNHALTASGSATSEGVLNLSPNGQFLSFTGYNASSGTAQVATSPGISRTVGVVGATGVVNTTTSLSDVSIGDNIRSAVTDNGSRFWVAGGVASPGTTGGVHFATIGASTSARITSDGNQKLSDVAIFNNQLYTSSNAGKAIDSPFRIGQVGTGNSLPTSGSFTLTNLPGISGTTNGALNSFFFADLDATAGASSGGLDTLYVADETLGIQKYCLVGSTWVAEGTVGAKSDNYRGLTGSVSGSTVTLYATGNPTGTNGSLISLTDLSGYKGAFASDVTTIATLDALTNEAFRGVAFAPVVAIPEPSALVTLMAGLLGLGGWSRFRKLRRS